MNARKAVEPVCLDVLVKWRGDEETGRDQMDEILREVVIITDSEADDDSSDEDDSSEEEGEVSSASSAEAPSLPDSRNQRRPAMPRPSSPGPRPMVCSADPGDVADRISFSSRTLAKGKTKVHNDKKAQRGFKRYQAAWDEALHRRQDPSHVPAAARVNSPLEASAMVRTRSTVAMPIHEATQYSTHDGSKRAVDSGTGHLSRGYYPGDSMSITRPVSFDNRCSWHAFRGMFSGSTDEIRVLITHKIGWLSPQS